MVGFELQMRKAMKYLENRPSPSGPMPRPTHIGQAYQ